MSEAVEFPVDNLYVQLEHLLIWKAVVELFPSPSVKTDFVWVCVYARASVVTFLGEMIR